MVGVVYNKQPKISGKLIYRICILGFCHISGNNSMTHRCVGYHSEDIANKKSQKYHLFKLQQTCEGNLQFQQRQHERNMIRMTIVITLWMALAK
jgi:hypothetical protein